MRFALLELTRYNGLRTRARCYMSPVTWIQRRWLSLEHREKGGGGGGCACLRATAFIPDTRSV